MLHLCYEDRTVQIEILALNSTSTKAVAVPRFLMVSPHCLGDLRWSSIKLEELG